MPCDLQYLSIVRLYFPALVRFGHDLAKPMKCEEKCDISQF